MELESKAQSLSDQCRVGHDTYDARKTPEFSLVGQNWAVDFSHLMDALLFRWLTLHITNTSDISYFMQRGFQMWLDEYKNYDYYTRTCRMGQCGHYTQIITSHSIEYQRWNL
ncbi:GLIPR1-like protein [Schistosoma japonicum]|uniref:GLIPR1-like protein n=1 Tax=Schistosoma japonicum TaxID=6182 RepID=A0A4Z2DE32_SCHJA|nr:GLIPR1-like protein [Schistosoma japonicum]